MNDGGLKKESSNKNNIYKYDITVPQTMKSRRQRKRSASKRKSRRGRILRGGYTGRYTITILDEAQRDVLYKAELIDENDTPTKKLEEYIDSKGVSSLSFKTGDVNWLLNRVNHDLEPACRYIIPELELIKSSPTGGAQLGTYIKLSCKPNWWLKN
jgi:hypothetical protein